VLVFLHGLLKFYEAQPLPASSVVDDWTRNMMEKVYTLAAETALPVDDYKAWFKSFSADTVLKGIDKVCSSVSETLSFPSLCKFSLK
jgi:UDP-glucose:glycoprotein glucosyltransferase